MSGSQIGEETSSVTPTYGLAWLSELMSSAFNGDAKAQLEEEDSGNDGSVYGWRN